MYRSISREEWMANKLAIQVRDDKTMAVVQLDINGNSVDSIEGLTPQQAVAMEKMIWNFVQAGKAESRQKVREAILEQI